MLNLLDTATASGLFADYVLFDNCFSSPVQDADIKSRTMDVITMIKKRNKIKYDSNGEQLNIKF